MAHSMQGCIRYSETDSNGKLTIEALINYFQDCSFNQSETIGYGLDYLAKVHRAWLVSAWQIHINRLPRLKEEIVVKTWPYDFKSFFGYRNFTMETVEGEMLAYSNSTWIYIDTDTGRPSRVPEEEMLAYGREEAYPMERTGRKLDMPEPTLMKEEKHVIVPSFFIDSNKHMNNGKYVMLAQQYVPETVQVEEIRVEYRKAAVLSDEIIPRTYLGEGQLKVLLDAEDGKPYCPVVFKFKE